MLKFNLIPFSSIQLKVNFIFSFPFRFFSFLFFSFFFLSFLFFSFFNFKWQSKNNFFFSQKKFKFKDNKRNNAVIDILQHQNYIQRNQIKMFEY